MGLVEERLLEGCWGTHLCTFRPPMLWNQWLQLGHCTVQCCGTSGYSWGIAQHHAVHAQALVIQQCICALLCPYRNIAYTPSTALGCVTGQFGCCWSQCSRPGCRSHASLSWRWIYHTTSLLGHPQPSHLSESGLSNYSGVPLVDVAGATIQRVSALECSHQASGLSAQATQVGTLPPWLLLSQSPPRALLSSLR